MRKVENPGSIQSNGDGERLFNATGHVCVN
jgi:hypothetical protein